MSSNTILLSAARRFQNQLIAVRSTTCRNLQNTQQQQYRWLSADISATASRPVRRTVSKAEREALRAERKKNAAMFLQQEGGATAASSSTAASAAAPTSGFHIPSAYSKYIWYLGLGLPTALLVWGFNDENSPPARFAETIGFTGLVQSVTDPFAKPVRNKLIPDWADVPNVPPDLPCPHTLVLDLENTLISSTWDRKLGWRHAKRPGVDKFLAELSQYYEIILYTPSDAGMIEPVVNSLDKNGIFMHRLYREATHYHNGIHVKDLNSLNRNINRMIVIDDNPDEVQFHPENLIRVKPYVDPTDREDKTLERITPLLIEIAREGYNNIPELLSQYRGMDADEIATEYENRIYKYTEQRQNNFKRGILGKVARGAGVSNTLPEPELQPANLYTNDAIPGQLTAKDIAGVNPNANKASDVGISGWFNRRKHEKEQDNMRKMEKWQEVMMKKQKQKQEQAEKLREQQLKEEQEKKWAAVA